MNNRGLRWTWAHRLSADYAQSLEALPKEGFYKVEAKFFCCSKECRQFKFESWSVRYDGGANPILFLPATAGSVRTPGVWHPGDARGAQLS